MTLVQDAAIIATLVLLEAVLSFDNAAILAVMARKLPVGGGRNRALNYGLLIAYVLRVLAIVLAVYLIEYPAFRLVGGAYLLFLFVRHVWVRLQNRKHENARRVEPAKGMFGLSPLATVVLQIGFIDLAFALDQVVAAVAFTHDLAGIPLHVFGLHFNKAQALIIVAATIGLVSLRILAPFLSRLMDWLPVLEDMAFVAVGFVGTLLVLENPVVGSNQPLYEMGSWVKIAITLALFLVPILVKLLFGVPKSTHEHRRDEKAIEAAQPGPHRGEQGPK